jgi:hypothetical protein
MVYKTSTSLVLILYVFRSYDQANTYLQLIVDNGQLLSAHNIGRLVPQYNEAPVRDLVLVALLALFRHDAVSERFT